MNRDSAIERRIARLRALGHVLDESFRIPGTDRRVGIDPLLGLVPVVGDVLGLLLSAYIVFEARRLGVPPRLVGRMVGNVAVETVIGAVPLVGDLFDAGWKANVRNVALLESHLAPVASPPAVPEAADRLTLLLLAVAACLLGIVVWMIGS